MKSFNVNLNTIDKVKNFVNLINTFDGDFDLASERYVIDAKSIMGIFSLDISNDLRLDIHDNVSMSDPETTLKDFIVK